MKQKIVEWLSVQRVKNPGKMLLIFILLFNIIFFFAAAGVISSMSAAGTEHMGFLEAAFCTITMILDAGCIQFVISDIGSANVLLALICLAVIFIGMITFTGAVIGYITNYIANFIDRANAGSGKLRISNHVVILNWNTRASEIVNDLLYCQTKQKVVILVSSGREEILKEVNERINHTIASENRQLMQQCKGMSLFKAFFYFHTHELKRNITVLVREGDIFSITQLSNVSLEHARSVIILGNSINRNICKFGQKELTKDENMKGDAQIIKALMQVADITGAASSDDNQRVIVEINDDWTWALAEKIIHEKQVQGKCNIVPIRVNTVLGQLLSQFSIMPELSRIYSELFSNKGSTFYSCPLQSNDECSLYDLMCSNDQAIPVAISNDWQNNPRLYYVANNEKDLVKEVSETDPDSFEIALNPNYWIEKKHVVVLGHNSKSQDIMAGFASFRSEWGLQNDEIIDIIVIDDEVSLKKLDNYRNYPFVSKVIPANIFDKDLIINSIETYADSHQEDTSVLILSDDSAASEDIDANALANLVYVRDIISRKMAANPDFDPKSIDVVVEIIDPKHYDIVDSYNIDNIVISNRYVSKMITQIGEKDALFEFYNDILSYDDTESTSSYESNEVYVKAVRSFFATLPGKCTARQLITGVYRASASLDDPAIVLGYVRHDGTTVLFGNDLNDQSVELSNDDKIIVFSAH